MNADTCPHCGYPTAEHGYGPGDGGGCPQNSLLKSLDFPPGLPHSPIMDADKKPAPPTGRQAKMLSRALELIGEGAAPSAAIEQAVSETPSSPGARRLAAKLLATLVARATTPEVF